MEDHSSCSTLSSSQQDEEIKELLMRKPCGDSSSDLTNEKSKIKLENLNSEIKQELVNKDLDENLNSSNNSKTNNDNSFKPQDAQNSVRKLLTEELKELIQKEKQTTADLFKQLLKCQEDQTTNTTNVTTNNNSSTNMQQSYMHQNSNSSDISVAELTNIHNNLTNNGYMSHQQQLSQRIKSATPVFVEQLLMSPLFNQFLPTCSSSSSSSSSATTNSTTNNLTSFSQLASAAVSAALTSGSIRKTPLSFSSETNASDDSLSKIMNHTNKSVFKRTKHDQLKG
jgi:hypothetical protein